MSSAPRTSLQSAQIDSEALSSPAVVYLPEGSPSQFSAATEPPRAILEPLPSTLPGESWYLEKIGELHSLWLGMDVSHALESVRQEVCSHADLYHILMSSMMKYGQMAPLWITSDNRTLLDGIHRLAIAHLLGWTSMIVSPRRMKWSQWDESDQGRKYHMRWRERLGIDAC